MQGLGDRRGHPAGDDGFQAGAAAAGGALAAAGLVSTTGVAQAGPVPAAGSFGGRQYGVAATSASDAWAVGGTDWVNSNTLIEHCDGTARARVPRPGRGASLNHHRLRRHLIVHSNGTAWK